MKKKINLKSFRMVCCIKMENNTYCYISNDFQNIFMNNIFGYQSLSLVKFDVT